MGPGLRPQSRILRCLYLLKARVGAPDWCYIACDRLLQCVGRSAVVSSCPQDDPVRAFSILYILSILSDTLLQCLWKDKDVSIITPSILGLRSSGSYMSSSVISGCIWNWCLSGVKSVTVDFGAEIKSEFSFR